jgi:oligoribonuclease NrnB/cAMP/cGMP phosphodiesterase (DHH superfamily)
LPKLKKSGNWSDGTASSSKYVVMYHKGCMDGFMAAVIAKWKLENVGTVVLVGTDPNEADVLATISGLLVDNNPYVNLYCYDVSMTQKTFDALLKYFPKALVFDHHKTTLGVATHPQLLVDITKSGAVLAWEHLYAKLPVPKIVSYIQDRDLWTWALPHSRSISAWLHDSHAPGIEHISKWTKLLENDKWFALAVQIGNTILAHDAMLIRKILATRVIRKIGGCTVAMVESHIFGSELGEAMYLDLDSGGNPTCDYAMVWRVDLDKKLVYVSLRSDSSNPKAVDVSSVAALHGGGGHRNAAGYTTTIESFFT